METVRQRKATALITTQLESPNSPSFQPQNCVPDVIIWMLTGNKRVAVKRIPSHLLIYSKTAKARGKLCGKVQTIFLMVRHYMGNFRYTSVYFVSHAQEWILYASIRRFVAPSLAEYKTSAEQASAEVHQDKSEVQIKGPFQTYVFPCHNIISKVNLFVFRGGGGPCKYYNLPPSFPPSLPPSSLDFSLPPFLPLPISPLQWRRKRSWRTSKIGPSFE